MSNPDFDAPQLPPYGDDVPDTMSSKMTGTANLVTRPHAVGERHVAVVELRCVGTGHNHTTDGVSYTETHKVIGFYPVGGDAGERLATVTRRNYTEANSQHLGHAELDGMTVVTDASGVVLTDAELAELRDDPAKVIDDGNDDDVVVEYDSGERLLWPYDYPEGRGRPVIDEEHPEDIENNEPRLVVALLDSHTGEPIDEEG